VRRRLGVKEFVHSAASDPEEGAEGDAENL
jgi:hypothetical protein